MVMPDDLRDFPPTVMKELIIPEIIKTIPAIVNGFIFDLKKRV
jgi:hypothetical protein